MRCSQKRAIFSRSTLFICIYNVKLLNKRIQRNLHGLGRLNYNAMCFILILLKCCVDVRMSHIRIRNRCVTYAVQLRIRNRYIYVWVSYVEFNTCGNNMISSHLTKLQRKIDTVRLCRPDMATDQDLHCLLVILIYIALNGVKPDQML